MKPATKPHRSKTKSMVVPAPSPGRERINLVRPMTLERIGVVYTRRLNDIHVATQTTIAALDRHRAEIEAGGDNAHHNFTVPSSGEKETARIRRHRREILQLLNALIEHGERGKSLLVAVSVTGDFILNALKLVLRAHPDRIGRGLHGGTAETTIRLDEFLIRSRDEILEERIQSRLNRALHASPTDYLKYLGDVLGIALDANVAARFIEAKATRDILVHADGCANDRYEEKAGALKRATAGERLTIEAAYFDASIRTMKRLVNGIHAAMLKRYGEDEAVNREVSRFMK